MNKRATGDYQASQCRFGCYKLGSALTDHEIGSNLILGFDKIGKALNSLDIEDRFRPELFDYSGYTDEKLEPKLPLRQ